MLEDEVHQKEKLEGEIAVLQSQLMQISFEADEVSSYLTFVELWVNEHLNSSIGIVNICNKQHVHGCIVSKVRIVTRMYFCRRENGLI